MGTMSGGMCEISEVTCSEHEEQLLRSFAVLKSDTGSKITPHPIKS